MKIFIAFPEKFKIFFLSWGLLLLCYTVFRVVFLWYNHELFPHTTLSQWVLIFLWGIKMDMSAIAWTNIPMLLLLFCAQYTIKRKTFFLRSSFILFIIINSAAFFINIIDIGYFTFNKRRSNADLLYVFKDSAGSFKSLFVDYWPLILLFVIAVVILIRGSKKVFFAYKQQPSTQPLLLFPAQLILLAFTALLARGWQARPLIPASPLSQINAMGLPVAQNSTNTFLYSLLHRQEQLFIKHYFTDEELKDIVGTNRYLNSEPFKMQKKNVVICILESFARGYLLPGDKHKAATPFFDSLIQKSIFFPNAYANGFVSNQGIVAILGGLPGFLDEPFYYSGYTNTPLKSIGNILKDLGYNTNFFMGAGKDHFGFGKFTQMAGINNYYSRSDFNDDRFYDGNWGIYDKPFLQFGASVLAKKQEPFMATFFTISSHPPFAIPEEERARFNFPHQTAAQNSISYVDDAFRQFFNAAKKSGWFNNSIFIFCADHWIRPDEKTSYNYINTSTIPLFIYDPTRSNGAINSNIASQVDIVPTILHLLHYTGSYTGFGRNLFDSSSARRYALNKIIANHQIITDKFVLGFDANRDKSSYLYQYRADSLIGNNLLYNAAYDSIQLALEKLIKANIQAYNNALNRRSLE